MSNSRAFTKIQTVVLLAIIIAAVVVGGVAYSLWGGTIQPAETIKIGVLADLDNTYGRHVWQGAVLAAEQVNAEGGVLNRNFEIVAQDDDSETSADIVVANNALTRLITVDKADFILDGGSIILPHQDICYEHKKILFSTLSMQEELTQRVIDNYEKYKYYFRGGPGNETHALHGNIDGLLAVCEYTGFTKIAFLWYDSPLTKALLSAVSDAIEKEGFEIVYSNLFLYDTTDFTSYFAAIEESGAEIISYFEGNMLLMVNEWYNRQMPAVLWGYSALAQEIDFWELTEGRCDSVSTYGYAVTAGYPLTSKTLPTREAYLDRWGELPNLVAAIAYDIVRFILPDAIERAGTLEVDAVIEALETVDVETSEARHFVFTSSHDIMAGENINDPSESYSIVSGFQWQNETMQPIYPRSLKEEAGVNLTFPPWPGPWD